MVFEDIIHKIYLDFVNRDYIIKLIRRSYDEQKRNNDYFKVFSLYGMGGIGKTYLLEELESIINKCYKPLDTDLFIIKVKLEITNSDDLLFALCKIRSQIHKPCKLFDYALLTYWNRIQVSKFDDSILHEIKTEWFTPVSELSQFIAIPVSGLPSFLSLSLQSVLKCIKKVIELEEENQCEQKFTELYKRIDLFSTDELRKCLAGFLGKELNQIYHRKHLILFVDSYTQYATAYFEDWLKTLIQTINTGIIIISSREPLKDLPEKIVVPQEIPILPEPEARKLLQKYIPYATEAFYENVIEITECIPIYLDLAINTYATHQNSSTEIKPLEFMYHDQKDVVHRFFMHLKPGLQDFMLYLSFIQLFDKSIFEYLVCKLQCGSILDFYDISSLSSVKHIENEQGFYKIHDTIATNVALILDKRKKYEIFKLYLSFICHKEIFTVSDLRITTLYKHLMNMIIQNEFELEETETEQILDIFFHIKQMMNEIDFSAIKDFSSYPPVKSIYYFTKAIYNERADTRRRLKWLEEIPDNPQIFGKHKKSFIILNGYLHQWRGNHLYLQQAIDTVAPTLQNNEQNEWYYAQTQIFSADHLTITGDFKKGEDILLTYLRMLESTPDQTNSIFQAKRHLGHLYRLNMMLDKANEQYLSTKDENGNYSNILQQIYIITNLCETNCYLNPDIVFEECYQGLRIGKAMKDSKSMAKIYYAMAIASLHSKHYKRANKYIRKSLVLDQLDGYKLGFLFPMLARILLQYCLGQVPSTCNYYKLLKQVDVYGFMKLPLALLNKDQTLTLLIKEKYNWLDFSSTVHNYKLFFDKLGISEVS